MTILSTFEPFEAKTTKTTTNNSANLQYIHLKLDDDQQWEDIRYALANSNTKSAWTQITMTVQLVNAAIERSNKILKHTAVKTLLKSKRKYDLFVLGYNFNDFHLGIAGHFQCPTVIISSMQTVKPLLDLVGNPMEVYKVSIMTGDNTEQIAFFGRMRKFIVYCFGVIITAYLDIYIQKPFYKENFSRIKGFPSLDAVRDNVSLILTNHHFSEGNIRPMVPNFVEIGGVQISATPKPLPEVGFSRLFK